MDTVIEHEALLFTDDPFLAVDQALTRMRPGRVFVRLLLHTVGPAPVATITATYRTAAFPDAPVFTGTGADERITTHLASHGLTTRTCELAEWDEPRTVVAVLAALKARAWPYPRACSDTRHHAGLAAATEQSRILIATGRTPVVRMRLCALLTHISAAAGTGFSSVAPAGPVRVVP
ncbi:hypothetical protein [Nocardiopsis nanhaiensis]